MKNILFIISLMLIIAVEIYPQYSFGPDQTDYRRRLHYAQDGKIYGDELAPLNTLFIIGRESGPTIWRAVYQWDIPDNEIPDNSRIDLIRLAFNYSDGSSSSDLYAMFYNISYDMMDENYFDDIFNQMDYSVNPIGSQTGSNHSIVFESSDPNSVFNKAIENSLPNNKFVLGIKWGNDFLLNNNNWFINNGSLTIYVEYTPPTHLVTIDQRNSSNQQVGVLKKWEENILDWGDNFYPGSQFSFDVGSRQTIQGDQRLISNEKYNNWNELSDVTNHHSFDIDNQTDVLTSHFLPSNSGIQIENSLEGTIVNGGSIKFADPWYIDFQDGDYGNSWRNRGMQEPRQFYARSVGTDGWQPDFTTVYPESPYPYNGVFLNQPYTGDNPVYYSVQAINSQPIYIENVGTRNFYFHNWNASPVNSASFQDISSATSAVVFNSDNAVISATLKGQGLSDNSEGFSTSSQRKIVRTSDGVLHRVYESLGHVWYEMSINNGQSWTIMNGGEPLDAGTGENPSIAGVCIDGDYNYVVVVFQQSETGIGFPYSIQLNVFGGLMPEDPLLLYPKLQTATIYSSGYQYTHNEATPSVAIRSGINTAGLQVVWHINSGLVMKEGGLSYLNNPPFSPLSLRTVSSTSSSSINPSIATYDLNNNGHFYLVWEENNSIKYAEYYASNFTNIQTISNLDGYTYNNRPSLIVLNDALSRICWKGTRYVYQIDPVTKTDNSFWDNRVVFRGINNNHF